MGKPGNGDSTQPLSDSQVVAVSPPDKPAPPGKPAAKHDQSVWKGLVLGANEFAPPVVKRSRAKWIIVGVLGVAALGGGLYATGLFGAHTDEHAQVPPQSPAPPPATQSPVPPTTPGPGSSATATITTPAPADAAPAVAADAATVDKATVDAISSVAPPIQPTKPPVKKKSVSTKKRGLPVQPGHP